MNSKAHLCILFLVFIFCEDLIWWVSGSHVTLRNSGRSAVHPPAVSVSRCQSLFRSFSPDGKKNVLKKRKKGGLSGDRRVTVLQTSFSDDF